MLIAILGGGWITRSGYGTLLTGTATLYGPEESLLTHARSGMFERPVKNFGRLDRLSRLTVATVNLALMDAGIAATPDNKQDIGIIGSNDAGTLETDTAYFTDFVDNGRKLARANLFIYTLPSSPLGEAAIHFGLAGPLLYTAGGGHSLAVAVNQATEMIAGGEAALMLVGMTSGDASVYVVLGPAVDNGAPSVDALLAAVDRDAACAEIITSIRNIKRG